MNKYSTKVMDKISANHLVKMYNTKKIKMEQEELQITFDDVVYDKYSETSSSLNNPLITVSVLDFNALSEKAKQLDILQTQMSEMQEELEMLRRENKELQQMVDA